MRDYTIDDIMKLKIEHPLGGYQSRLNLGEYEVSVVGGRERAYGDFVNTFELAIFELLTRSGRSLPLVKMMLMPEAWSKRSKIIPQAYRDMYNYLNSVIEPWDGPAAIAATDGNWILAATDRNGLRPLRYTITKDKILFAGSETGMVPVQEENIIYRGRVGPGQMIAVNLDEGVYYNDKKIKDLLSRNPI